MSESINSLQDVPAMILAGGLGTRLRSVVSGQPKVLAEVNGRPYLSYLLDQLSGAGVRDVVFCSGYLGDHLEQAFGSDYRGLRLSYSREPAPLGTAGALRLASEEVRPGLVLVLNGDSYIDLDLAAFLAFHLRRQSSISMVLAEVPDTRRFGRVQLGADEQITFFEDKGSHIGPGLINAGVYLLESKTLEAIPTGRAVSIEREVFPAMVGQGLNGYVCRGKFIDIGTPETYADAQAFFA
jgi:NDP-sugar pyrophosphorylase family protein